ncbi:hypothetical protein QAD02_012688 [Eretmocerus hayati]|uniref:Uncharacterized protein n=1 Tax=Eretmocerus hayati TaxID=131215 RepID=A0ACC2P255_9HYME|nr:hypothetical protein QAD02_012688 [Eretmocerus hayati]
MLTRDGHGLSQKAMQMWLLTRAFPYIFADKAEEDDQFMRVVLELNRIMAIVFAPRVPASVLPYLESMPVEDLSLDDSSHLTSRKEVKIAPTSSDERNCDVLDMDVGLPNTVPVQNQPGKKLTRVQTSNLPAVPSKPVSNANDRGSKRKRVSENETLLQPTNEEVKSSKRQRLNSDSCDAVHPSSASVAVEAPLTTENLQYTRHGTLEQTLKRRSQGGAALVNRLKVTPSPSDKRAMNRILVDELIECTGSCYPKPEVKTALTKSIVTEFPLLRHPRGFGYQQFYDPITRRHGSIETRLWTVRKDLPKKEKKIRSSPNPKMDDEFERIHPKSAKKYKEQFPTYFVPRILVYAKALYRNTYEEVNDKYKLESGEG